ncbi:MAG TPA: DUF2911 domain-containing protein [Thermoanaerobaculia bacterium]
MRAQRTLTLATVAAALLAPAIAPAQDLHPSRRPSPMGMARIMLDGDAYVRVVYSRPYKRGRENIFGSKESKALVPYGELWRTGANEATEITVTEDVTVAGKKLAAGTYSLFTTPNADSWKIHFNSLLGLDGVGHFDPAAQKFTPADLPPTDVLVVDATPTTLPEDKEVDQLSFSFEKTDGGADMVLRWIRTEVRLPIAVAK